MANNQVREGVYKRSKETAKGGKLYPQIIGISQDTGEESSKPISDERYAKFVNQLFMPMDDRMDYCWFVITHLLPKLELKPVRFLTPIVSPLKGCHGFEFSFHDERCFYIIKFTAVFVTNCKNRIKLTMNVSYGPSEEEREISHSDTFIADWERCTLRYTNEGSIELEISPSLRGLYIQALDYIVALRTAKNKEEINKFLNDLEQRDVQDPAEDKPEEEETARRICLKRIKSFFRKSK